ncbi:unnamed protein product [Orchesella dallaii]|uniref:Peptidylamidoglycolate lyase n=1 Tax=Orchesella dallaii TaxID=48710 RepID=A0ABP1QEH7_9HEXA
MLSNKSVSRPYKPNWLQNIVLIYLLSSSFTCVKSSNNAGSFELDKSWPDPSVVSLEYFGSGVALNSKNNVVLLHRSNKMVKIRQGMVNLTDEIIEDDVVLVLDAISGKIKASWGRGKFVKPHGIEISEAGHLFVTDVSLHQVFKFRYDEKTELWEDTPTLTIGERFVPGNDHDHFCSPADVAVMPITGEFFVADGYCNSRIVKFSKDGTYLTEFHSGSSSQPNLPSVAFNVTHAVAIAIPCEASAYDESLPPVIFVADRNNGRVQASTENGTYLYEIPYKVFGHTKEMLLSFSFSKRGCSPQFYGTLFAINGHLPLGQSKVFEILVSNVHYKLVSSFAVSNMNNGVTRIETPHDIAVSASGQVLYVVEAYDNLTIKRFQFHASNSGTYLEISILRYYILALTICLFI